MNKLKYCFLIGTLFLSLSCEKNDPIHNSTLKKAEIIFDRTYESINDFGHRIIIGKNDEMFINDLENTICLTEKGDIKWILPHYSFDIAPTNDGGSIITYIEILGNYQDPIYHLAKLDSEGIIEWDKSGEEYQLSRIVVGEDNRIFGVGDFMGASGFKKPKFFKYSSDGQFLSSSFIVDEHLQISYETRHFLKLSNNDFVISTRNNINTDRTNYDFNIIEFDINANNVRENHYGGYKDEYLTDLIELPNNELVLVGVSESKDGDIKSWREELTLTTNAWIVKLGSDRKIIWEKIMGGSLGAWFAKVMHKDNYLFVGFQTSSTDVDFNAPETPKFGFVVFNNVGDIQEMKFIERSVIWSGEAGCAYDSKGNLVMLTGDYDEYYGTYTLRIMKIR